MDRDIFRRVTFVCKYKLMEPCTYIIGRQPDRMKESKIRVGTVYRKAKS